VSGKPVCSRRSPSSESPSASTFSLIESDERDALVNTRTSSIEIPTSSESSFSVGERPNLSLRSERILSRRYRVLACFWGSRNDPACSQIFRKRPLVLGYHF